MNKIDLTRIKLKMNASEVIFQSKRLLYRPLQDDDAPELAVLLHDDTIYKRSLNLPYPFTVDDALRLIRDQDRATLKEIFAVIEQTEKKLVGVISFSYSFVHRHAELGYAVHRDYRGLGYGTEAVGAAVHYAFHTKGLQRVFCRQLGDNAASEKIMMKTGLQREGLLVGHLFKIDRYVDVTIYGITRP